MSSTQYKFNEDKSKYSAELTDYNNKYSYLKLDIGLVYTPLNQLYDINLLFSYKNSKISNSTKIGVAISFKI